MPTPSLSRTLVLIAGLSLSLAATAAPATQPSDAQREKIRERIRERISERAKGGEGAQPLASLTPKTWSIPGKDGKAVERTALLYVPPNPDKKPLPLVFVFHGHGGGSRQAAASFHLHTVWPEAIVIYPQGLPSKGMTDPEGKKNGWETQRDSDHARDLDFFDAILASLKKEYPVDSKAIFATGHSNGGSMTYMLWARRADTFAAFAPSSSIAGFMMPELKPKPALILAGETDPIVKPEWQQRNADKLKELNGGHDPAKDFGHAGPHPGKRYDGKAPANASTVLLIHPGGHELLLTAPEDIVTFFKEFVPNAKSTTKP